MRINNNVNAMNAHRQYSINTANIAKSTEKLSSGYRINRAGDDAAGLAISEKMRAQIRGLTMASKNSQDAISLVQTAEGALQSTHNVLQRMRELAVQSASDTNEQSIDRAALQAEFAQLIKEIDDTASKTRFNDQNLIDGTFQKNLYSISTQAGNLVGNMNGYATVANGAPGSYTLSIRQSTVGNVVGKQPDPPIAAKGTSSITDISAAINGTPAYSDNLNGDWTLGYDEDANNFYLQKGTDINTRVNATNSWMTDADTSDGVDIEFTDMVTITAELAPALDLTAGATTQAQFGNAAKNATVSISGGVTEQAGVTKFYATMTGAADVEVKAGDSSVAFNNGITVNFDALTAAQLTRKDAAAGAGSASQPDDAGFAFADFAMTLTVVGRQQEGLIIQTGANQGDQLEISIDRMDSEYLGVATAKIGDRSSASYAITQVNNAINQVSTQRAQLGALQNRLDYKISNLDTSAENLTAAESRIRDLDMAKEMTNFTKNNILFQASTAMLAQANSAPQGVLQLLQ